MLKMFRWVMLSLVICSSPIMFTGCEQDSPVEEAADDVEDAADELD